MITRSYDVIVAGLRPGGLLAGALLARRGFRVLAIRQDYLAPPSIGKYHFVGHRYPLMGLENPHFLGGAFDALTIHPTERKQLQAATPSYQVVTPRSRVDIYSDERLDQELEREFGPDQALVSAIYQRLKEEAATFIESWEQKKEVLPTPTMLQKVGLGSLSRKDKALFQNRPMILKDLYAQLEVPRSVQNFFDAQLIAFSYCVNPEYLPLPIAGHLLTNARAGLYGDGERHEPLLEILTERIRTLHSDVRVDKSLDGLDFSWGKLANFSFEGDSQLSTCDYLIWNDSFSNLLSLLPEGIRRKGYEDRSTLGDYEQFSIYVGVAEFVLPVGIQDTVFMVGNDELPLCDGNLVYLSLSPEGEEQFAPPGCRALTLTTLVRAEPESRSMEARRKVATTMMVQLKRLVPWLEDHIKVLHIPEVDENYPAPEVYFDAQSLISLFPTDAGPGPRLPHWNFFHIGRETWPMLGVDGEIGAAVMVDRAIGAMVNRK